MFVKQLFICDAFASLNQRKDTSCALMKAAILRGHETFFCEAKDLFLEQDSLKATLYKVAFKQDILELALPAENVALSSFNCIWIRKDPPFDSSYLELTWMLDYVSSKTWLINSPSGLRSVNEKIWALNFNHLIPKTIICSKPDSLVEQFEASEAIILKPTHLFGGQGIVKTSLSDKCFDSQFKTLSKNYTRSIIVQAYVKDAIKGDKRILLWKGKVLGAVLRVNEGDDFRHNFFSGGKAVDCTITSRDKEIIQALSPHLNKLGLDFVGIDILGDYLTEVNVTSPTCLVEMNHFAKTNLESMIFDDIEKKLAVKPS